MKKVTEEPQETLNEASAPDHKMKVRPEIKTNKRKKSKKQTKLKYMLVNLNGIKGKVKSLENNANSANAHIVAVTETKQKPARLQGYGKWISKERTKKGGGGVAICARQDIANKLTKSKNTGNIDQDILWTEFKNTQKEITQLATYYGKQEKEKRSTILTEFQELTTQVNQVKNKGEIIMGGDFNAKLKNDTKNHKQEISPNGTIMKENLLEHTQLEPISMKSEPGKWTREHRTNPNEKSIIDYVLMTPKLADKVTSIMVDEEGMYRIEGKNPTDHNTIIVETELDIDIEKKTIYKWNLNNKDGWRNYNKRIQQKHREKPPKNQEELTELIISTLKETIGQTKITTGGKNRKASQQEKDKRENKKTAKKIYEQALKQDRNDIKTKLEKYMEAQKELRDQIELDLQKTTKEKLEKYRKEGHMKQNQIWKLKNEAETSKENDQYDTITEEGKLLQEPEETKDYIANFFEDLYQARPAKNEYQNITEKIEQEVKNIEQELKNKPPIEDFSMQELNNAIKKLKRKKATGPDNIPNEIFIEADQETKSIYLRNFNEINKTMNIPVNWQEGEIIRIYKGKGVKGKCSNERGITKSSNYGKVYERLINERILKKLNISDAQAGGRKGSATVDHILLLKEIFKAAKREGINIDLSLLDVTKAYDKAWLTGIMHVLHKQGLQDNHWTIVKRLNENLTAKILTKFGLTRSIKIKDSIRQGGVLSTTLYGILMDEISKAINASKNGIQVIKNQLRIGSLLWVDDVAIVEKEGELQEPLNTTDEISSKYHIEYGKSKSNTMTIKNNRKKQINKQYRIGTMNLDKTKSYKYLGYHQNEKNNNDDQLKAVQNRTEGAYQKMMALTGNTNFHNLEMDTIWLVTKACIVPAITYSGETWEPNKQNYDNINKILDSIIKRILKTPKGTPREPLYIETGLLDPETIIINNRLNMEARIRRNDNKTMQLLLNDQSTNSWAQQNNQLKSEMNLTEDDLKGNKDTIKQIIKEKTTKRFQSKISESGKDKSKVQYYLEGKKEWKAGQCANYMSKLNRNQASALFKARTRMLPIKGNQKHEYTDKNGATVITCRICNTEDETQQHILENCQTIMQKYPQVTKEMIFSENIQELKLTANTIKNIMEMLQEQTSAPKTNNLQTQNQDAQNNNRTKTR